MLSTCIHRSVICSRPSATAPSRQSLKETGWFQGLGTQMQNGVSQGSRKETLCRVAMVIAAVCCMQGSFLLENPASSCLLLHPRLAYVLSKLREFGCPDTLLQDVLNTSCWLNLVQSIGFPESTWTILRSMKSMPGFGNCLLPMLTSRRVCKGSWSLCLGGVKLNLCCCPAAIHH